MNAQAWTIVGVGAAMVAVLITCLQLMLGKVGAPRTELKADGASPRTELKTDIASRHEELQADIASLRTEIKADFAALAADLSQVGERVANIEGRLDEISAVVRATLSRRAA
ncbi:MAG: hypothetical protein ACYDAG_05770 [Chloroflexota bacterium]